MKRLSVIPLALAGVLLAGCSYRGASSLPLPGAIGGSGTYPVTVILADATNLVVKETCRSNDTVVGSVESITLTPDLKAKVVCRIKDSVHLAGNATATLSETSLLGEPFVALDPPSGSSAEGVLAPGTVIPVSDTHNNPDVEVVLGALSQVLNGGSLGSLQTITTELNTALRGSDLRGTLDQVNHTVATFNAHRDEITSSLVALDRLSGQLSRQRGVIAQALDSIPGGLTVLDRQRAHLVATLTKLSNLSTVAVPLLDDTRANVTADLHHLAPVLAQVSKAGGQLAQTLNRIVTFPFPSTALSTIRGDFAGMYATIDVNADMLNQLLGGSKKYPVAQPAKGASTGASATAPSGLGGLSSVLGSVPPAVNSLTQLLTGLLGGKG